MSKKPHAHPVPAVQAEDTLATLTAAPRLPVTSLPAPAEDAPETRPAAIDANGFDPREFEWRPVPRRTRKDGWTPEAQQRFIEALARTGVVDQACEEVGLSVRSAYNLRNAAGGERFARAWSDVLARAADRLLDVAFEQAIMGEEVPIFDQDGVRTGAKRRYNTRMAMFLLRAYHPDRFRHAHKDERRTDEAVPQPSRPAPEAVAALAPVTPAEPHLLMPPEELDHRVELARETAEMLAAVPCDERDHWKVQTVGKQHPRVAMRARRNRYGRDKRQDRIEAAMERDGIVLYNGDDD
jgi:hypothetical protein